MKISSGLLPVGRDCRVSSHFSEGIILQSELLIHMPVALFWFACPQDAAFFSVPAIFVNAGLSAQVEEELNSLHAWGHSYSIVIIRGDRDVI